MLNITPDDDAGREELAAGLDEIVRAADAGPDGRGRDLHRRAGPPARRGGAAAGVPQRARSRAAGRHGGGGRAGADAPSR